MRIKIIQIGKSKQNFVKEAEEEYAKRLGPYCQIESLTLKDQSVNSENTSAGIEIIKKKEADEIFGRLEKTPLKAFIIVLDENGKQFTSPEFSALLENRKSSGHSEIIFIIGGCYGLHQTVIQKADLVLSFSRFTFTHEMIRPLLLEQIYRAFTIAQNKKYHY